MHKRSPLIVRCAVEEMMRRRREHSIVGLDPNILVDMESEDKRFYGPSDGESTAPSDVDEVDVSFAKRFRADERDSPTARWKL